MGVSRLQPAGGANDFTLDIGSSGDTTFELTKEYAPGAYSITSQLADASLDVYIINADGSSAGYTNTKSLTATKGFNKIVVYGATTNDLLIFEYKTTFSPTDSGDVDDGAAPFLTSATPTTLESIDDTTTVTGGNFADDVEIVFTGQDDVDRAAKNIVRSSSTSLIVTRPDSFPVEQEPFTMTATNAGITNPSVGVNVLTDYFDAGGVITWVTTSPLPSAIEGIAYSTTLEATDADATSVVYAVTTGLLPTGLSFNGSTGVISGTPTTAESQTFTVTATDAGGNASGREFVLAVVAPTVEYLVIAGGGGGSAVGTNGTYGGGGGGAGGYRSSVSGESSGGGASAETPFAVAVSTNYTVTVGAGGAGAVNELSNAGSGINSVFATITSTGGGPAPAEDANGLTGGSGGGAGLDSASRSGGAGTAGQGFEGGDNNSSGINGGGGGGAGQAGGDGGGVNNSFGGDGVSSSITGTATFRAGGGAGGIGKPGGDGGGASSPATVAVGNNGVANTGGGGSTAVSASGVTRIGGNGGSGVVILRYSAGLSVVVGAGLSSYTLTDGANKVTVFTAGSDNISFEVASAEVTPVDYLVVAGGAGGNTSNGGGGGAGGYRSSVGASGGGVGAELAFAFTSSTSYSVTVGAGGATAGNTSSSGVNSTVGSFVSIGGGRPANRSQTVTALQGGSGGGGASVSNATYYAGAPGIAGQGFAGARGVDLGSYLGGGGGGAGEAGDTDGRGHGGDGIASDITGTSVFRGGGGAAGANGGTYPGGEGGGGGGGTSATSGVANTGGGGGSTGGATAGNGGSGVVILRYPATKTLTVGAGLTSTTSTVGANKVTVLTAGTGTVSLS
jgi:hypothetical protein